MSEQYQGGRLAGKRLIVTGAAAGIGEATARRAAADGAQVALVDVDPRVQQVASELGGLAFVTDVRDPDGAQPVVDAVVAQLGGLDGLANIAGGGAPGGAVETSDEVWDRVIALNLTSAFRWSRAAIPVMQRSGSGSIVNMSSIAGTHALPQSVGYVTAKAGVLGLTRSIAIDYGRTGVRCNAICPGSIETELLQRYMTRRPDVAEGLMQLNFAGRFGQADEVAALCVYLLSDESGFVNGAAIPIDGGRAGASVALK